VFNGYRIFANVNVAGRHMPFPRVAERTRREAQAVFYLGFKTKNARALLERAFLAEIATITSRHSTK
jgi:hypothetical protein